MRIGAASASALLMCLLVAPSASASGRTQIQLQDRCDPATFNAVLGEGACVGDGDVTFEELIATINPEDFGHGAWRFSREDTHIDRGQSLHLHNTGGETHSFTEVQNFGPGIVEELNGVFGEGTPAAVPVPNTDPRFIGPGGTQTVSGLSVGTHRFECLIHPWMQSTVVVRR